MSTSQWFVQGWVVASENKLLLLIIRSLCGGVYVCVCVSECVCVRACVWVGVWLCEWVHSLLQQNLYSWFNAVNWLTFDNSRNMWKHFGLEKFFSPRNFCIWFVLLKRLPYFIQYLYSTSHCATATDIWSFYYNLDRRLCSSKSQYFYRQWILHWICSKWDQPF